MIRGCMHQAVQMAKLTLPKIRHTREGLDWKGHVNCLTLCQARSCRQLHLTACSPADTSDLHYNSRPRGSMACRLHPSCTFPIACHAEEPHWLIVFSSFFWAWLP